MPAKKSKTKSSKSKSKSSTPAPVKPPAEKKTTSSKSSKRKSASKLRTTTMDPPPEDLWGHTIQNFIGGKFVEPLSKKYLDNVCPSTGKVFGRLADSNFEDVDDAVVAAQAAFPKWSAMSAQERSNILLKVADLVESRLDEFAEAESLDNGKPVWLARAVDIPRVSSNFRFFATHILHSEDHAMHMPDVVSYTLHEPVGVAGLISPWNLPLYLLSWKIAPAIAFGNTCVCKPSEFTSLTASMLCGVLNDAGVPAGVVNMVFGLGKSAGSALVQHPDVPLISFTGGTATGEIIMKEAAPFFKKVSLELGGKNPNIIFDDANIDECLATTLRSSFANQGQICLAGSRIFVQSGVYDQFVQRFKKEASSTRVGDPKEASSMLGALVSKPHLEKIMKCVKVAQEEGGTIECGGKQPSALPSELEEGFFYEPTIISGLGTASRTLQEEIFGPVVTITPFETEEEVVQYANQVKYGLSATVWTQNLSRAHRVAHKIQAGTVWINCWLVRDLRVPFGGYKQSGVGREGGKYSEDFYTEQKTVCIKL